MRDPEGSADAAGTVDAALASPTSAWSATTVGCMDTVIRKGENSIRVRARLATRRFLPLIVAAGGRQLPVDAVEAGEHRCQIAPNCRLRVMGEAEDQLAGRLQQAQLH
jgi:hypothetical protein